MIIDYIAESEKYRPVQILTLLVGEAPPPSGDKYFYIPTQLSLSLPIEKDRSLPSTIFNHYFKRRPQDKEEYHLLLKELQKRGIFLIDIYEKPIKVRNNLVGIQKITDEIPQLRRKLAARNIEIADSNIVFLLARGNYQKQIKAVFPDSKQIRWIKFRLTSET